MNFLTPVCFPAALYCETGTGSTRGRKTFFRLGAGSDAVSQERAILQTEQRKWSPSHDCPIQRRRILPIALSMEWHPDVRSASVEPGVPLQSSYQLRPGLRAPSHLPPPRSAAVHYCLWGDPHRGQYATTPGFVGRLTAPIVQGSCSAGAHGSPTTRRHSRAPSRGVMATADTRIGTDGLKLPPGRGKGSVLWGSVILVVGLCAPLFPANSWFPLD